MDVKGDDELFCSEVHFLELCPPGNKENVTQLTLSIVIFHQEDDTLVIDRGKDGASRDGSANIGNSFALRTMAIAFRTVAMALMLMTVSLEMMRMAINNVAMAADR